MNESTNKKQILIVEDDEKLLEAINDKLIIEGITTVPFSKGNKALNYLVNAERLPDLIWLDYYLKDMNGLEFMHELKSISGIENVPVVVVSNSQNEANVEEFKALGAVDYLIKTEKKIEDIVSILKSYLEKYI